MLEFFNIQNLFSVIITLALLFVSGFSLYLPIFYLAKSKAIAIKFSIPISFSIQIIFGYLFYDIGHVKAYPICYLAFILILNAYAWQKLKHAKLLNSKNKPSLRNIFLCILAIIPIIYTRFYDAVRTVAPGNIDTLNHMVFLKDLATTGFLYNNYYAPGFHLLIFPLTFFIPYADIYRFTGPVLGIITVLSIYLLLRDSFKHKISKIILLILFSFPLYNQLALQTIGFFSSALTFMFIAVFLFLASQPKELDEKTSLLFFFISSTALALTVPYLFIQLLPIFFIILVLIWLFKKTFPTSYRKFILKLFLILILGFFTAFAHVYMQTHILHPGNSSFPEIPTVAVNKQTQKNSPTVTSNYETAHPAPAFFIVDSALIRTYLLPMYNIAFDILKIKNIRQLNTLLNIGSYLWILISGGLLLFSIRKKQLLFFNVALFSLVFGLATQTGILEMSFYRGRSGWYLLLFSLIGISFIFDQLYDNPKLKKVAYPLIGILVISAFINPPVFYRSYFTDTFDVAYKIKQKYPNQKITFFTNQSQLTLLSENFSTQTPLEGCVAKSSTDRQRFVILEDKFFCLDPVLSQQAYSTDKNFSEFNGRIENAKKTLGADTAYMRSSHCLDQYKEYWHNDTISIYKMK